MKGKTRVKNCRGVRSRYIVYRTVGGVNWFYVESDSLSRCMDICAALGDNSRVEETANIIQEP